MSPCQPIGGSYRVTAPGTSARDISKDDHSDEIAVKNKLDIEIKVTSGENINGGLTCEKLRQEQLERIEEEPSEKRPRPNSVELAAINELSQFRPNIAESIKLRERNTSLRYTDSEADPQDYYYSDFRETSYAGKERRSPSTSHNGSPQPYTKKINGTQNGKGHVRKYF